jgi:hypothetical protein
MSKTLTAVTGVHITEGRAGMWFYHLSRTGVNGESLCGRPTMSTQMPLRLWGTKGHLNERYCTECEEAGRTHLLAAGVDLTKA